MFIPKMHFVFYLAVLSIAGFLATDMYLPAFDIMHTDLMTTRGNIGASLSIFLGGFAVGQIIWGRLADRYGKPEALLLGLTLFTFSSVILFFTQNIYLFLGWRLVQALGICSAAVCWQALVIDSYPEAETKKIFASIMPLVALSPALSPLLGVVILETWSWRYIFLVLAGVGAILMIYTRTLWGKYPRKAEVSDRGGFGAFFRSRYFMGNVLIYGFCSAGFFAWLTGAPFFLKTLGYSESEIGWSFVTQTIAFIVGGYGYQLISGRIDGKKLIPYLLTIYALSMFSLFFMSLFTTPDLLRLLIPFSAMAFANGACYPIVVAEALRPFAHQSGQASSLQNTIQLGISFLASVVVSAFSKNALIATGSVMAATALLAGYGYLLTKTPYRRA